ncbi:MAG: VanZ family protein [Sedimentisphaerales bacterium]
MENRDSFLYRRRTAILFILILMWTGAFTATHIPARYITAGYIPGLIASLGDVVLHGIGFLVLSSWFILTLAAFGVKPKQRILLVLLIMIVYGAVDEYTQQFFGRSTELKDWLSDTTATVISLILLETILFLAKITGPSTSLRTRRTKIPQNERDRE